jgi:hypothetical protein
VLGVNCALISQDRKEVPIISGWGEQTIVSRVIYADVRCRFNFPTKFVPL